MLLKSIDVHASDNYGQRAMHRVALAEKPCEALASTMVHYAEGHLTVSDDRRHTPLCYAAAKSSADVLKAFLSASNVTHKTLCGEHSLLHSAATFYNAATLQLLVNNGADVSAVDTEGNLPLHCLLKKPCLADVNFALNRFDDLETPLLVDVVVKRREMQQDALSVLLTKKRVHDNINAVNSNGQTPLHVAMNQWTDGNVEVARVLLVEGADIEAVDKEQNKPLQLAIGNNCTNLVNLLLLYNATIGETNIDGASATIKEMLQKAQYQRKHAYDTAAHIVQMDEERRKMALNAERITQGVLLGSGTYGLVYAGVWHLPDVKSENLAPSVRFRPIVHLCFN